jgi:hypothetical protein
MKVLFWVSAIGIVYGYLGYPVLLFILRLFFDKPIRKAPIEPVVSLIIPAHNEARVNVTNPECYVARLSCRKTGNNRRL